MRTVATLGGNGLDRAQPRSNLIRYAFFCNFFTSEWRKHDTK